MKEVVSQTPPPRSRGVSLQRPFLSGPRLLVNRAPRLEQHWAQCERVVAVEFLMADGNAEESRIAECLVWSPRLDVSPQGLRASVDAEHQLRSRPLAGCSAFPAVIRDPPKNPFCIGVLVCRQPDRPVHFPRKSIEPLQQHLRPFWGQRSNLPSRQPEPDGEQIEPARCCSRILVCREIPRALPRVSHEPGKSSGHAEVPSASCFDKLGLVEQPHGEVLHQIDRVVALTGVLGVLAAPPYEACPPRELCRHARLVSTPALTRDFQADQAER